MNWHRASLVTGKSDFFAVILVILEIGANALRKIKKCPERNGRSRLLGRTSLAQGYRFSNVDNKTADPGILEGGGGVQGPRKGTDNKKKTSATDGGEYIPVKTYHNVQ